MSIKNAKLGTKLALGFGIVIVLLAGVAGIYQYSVQTAIGGFNNLLEVDSSIATEAADVNSAMLQCRRSEKDFLLRLDKKYLAKLETNVDTVKAHAQSIVDLAIGDGRDETAAKTAKIIAFADEYLTAFKDMVKSCEIKGLNHTTGLQGKFRTAAGALAVDLQK
ncbi:MAG: hypothetical protein GY801_20505, partial [bacterium]|nr:hypothetical protein [bacterium]